MEHIITAYQFGDWVVIFDGDKLIHEDHEWELEDGIGYIAGIMDRNEEFTFTREWGYALPKEWENRTKINGKWVSRPKEERTHALMTELLEKEER